MIPEKTHNALTRIELHSLISACERCECGFDCYCARNIEWAERKLAELDAREGCAIASHQRSPAGD